MAEAICRKIYSKEGNEHRVYIVTIIQHYCRVCNQRSREDSQEINCRIF